MPESFSVPSSPIAVVGLGAIIRGGVGEGVGTDHIQLQGDPLHSLPAGLAPNHEDQFTLLLLRPCLGNGGGEPGGVDVAIGHGGVGRYEGPERLGLVMLAVSGWGHDSPRRFENCDRASAGC